MHEIKLPELNLPEIEIPKIDVGKAVLGAATAAGLVERRRSRWPSSSVPASLSQSRLGRS